MGIQRSSRSGWNQAPGRCGLGAGNGEVTVGSAIGLKEVAYRLTEAHSEGVLENDSKATRIAALPRPALGTQVGHVRGRSCCVCGSGFGYIPNRLRDVQAVVVFVPGAFSREASRDGKRAFLLVAIKVPNRADREQLLADLAVPGFVEGVVVPVFPCLAEVENIPDLHVPDHGVGVAVVVGVRVGAAEGHATCLLDRRQPLGKGIDLADRQFRGSEAVFVRFPVGIVGLGAAVDPGQVPHDGLAVGVGHRVAIPRRPIQDFQGTRVAVTFADNRVAPAFFCAVVTIAVDALSLLAAAVWSARGVVGGGGAVGEGQCVRRDHFIAAGEAADVTDGAAEVRSGGAMRVRGRAGCVGCAAANVGCAAGGIRRTAGCIVSAAGRVAVAAGRGECEQRCTNREMESHSVPPQSAEFGTGFSLAKSGPLAQSGFFDCAQNDTLAATEIGKRWRTWGRSLSRSRESVPSAGIGASLRSG